MTSLDSCISSLQHCSNLVRDTSAKIQARAQTPEETQRILTVLQLTRKYEEVTQSEVVAAQSQQAAEIAPQVQDLIAGVEKQLAKLSSKEKKLRSQSELNMSRLEQFPVRQVRQETPPGVEDVGEDELRQLEELQRQRERLKVEISRLNLAKRKSIFTRY